MTETLENLIQEKINLAIQGRKFWIDLETEDDFKENDVILFFPDKGTACNDYVLENMSEFFEKRKISKAFILSVEERVCRICEQEFSNICCCKQISDAEAEQLLAYYALQEFSSGFLVISLDVPKGRFGRSIAEINGMTEREIVRIGILGLTGGTA